MDDIRHALSVLAANADEFRSVLQETGGLHVTEADRNDEPQLLRLATPEQRAARRQRIGAALQTLVAHSGDIAGFLGTILKAIPATAAVGDTVSQVGAVLPHAAPAGPTP